MLLETVVDEKPLAPLVRAEKHDGPRERASKRRQPAAVQTAHYTLLPPNPVVRLAERCVLRGDVRVALLPRLDGVKGMHEHVTGRASNATSDHGLQDEKRRRKRGGGESQHTISCSCSLSPPPLK